MNRSKSLVWTISFLSSACLFLFPPRTRCPLYAVLPPFFTLSFFQFHLERSSPCSLSSRILVPFPLLSSPCSFFPTSNAVPPVPPVLPPSFPSSLLSSTCLFFSASNVGTPEPYPPAFFFPFLCCFVTASLFCFSPRTRCLPVPCHLHTSSFLTVIYHSVEFNLSVREFQSITYSVCSICCWIRRTAWFEMIWLPERQIIENHSVCIAQEPDLANRKNRGSYLKPRKLHN